MRGRGWLANYSIGDQAPYRGVPLVSAFTWDTGVQVHAASDRVDATAAVTAGTVSNPLFHDDNDGKQVAGRLAFRPVTGLVVGASAARGPFVSRTAARGAVGDGNEGRFTQTAWGADVEYSRDYYLVRVETILSDWTLPIVRAPHLDLPLRAFSTSVEGRYKIQPGLYAAARVDHIGFSEITGLTGDRHLGRAGHARRSRRRLLAAAQSGAEAVVSIQLARRRTRSHAQPGRRTARVLVLMTRLLLRVHGVVGGGERRRSPARSATRRHARARSADASSCATCRRRSSGGRRSRSSEDRRAPPSAISRIAPAPSSTSNRRRAARSSRASRAAP